MSDIELPEGTHFSDADPSGPWFDADDMRAYAEQAVRDALAEAAALCHRKFLAMAAGGYPREASTARRLTAQIEALIPENNHE